MAMLSTDGFDKLTLDLNEIAQLPDEVTDGMLDAGADVLVTATKESARTMLTGKYATGELAEAVIKGRIGRSKNGKHIQITFKGSRTRGKTTTANSEIAFINEFGKHGQPARPFIRTANESKATEAVDAAAKVYDNYLTRKGF